LIEILTNSRKSVWIGDTEVWRTCTAEPTWSGIHFGYAKDITAFASLLNAPQPIVVDIDNYIVGRYNGTFNASLSIIFYNISTISARGGAADEIVSISKVVSGDPNTYYSLPDDTPAILLSIPSNTTRVVLDVLASGNAKEEFWYTNVPNPYVDTLQKWNISLLGQGTFREILVSVDGNPVAAAWPFEVVFTGGISPAFWRPIVDYRTFDLPSYRFDLTSLLPLLRDGTHQISLEVLGQPTTLENWYITGQIHLWHADAEHSNNSIQANDSYISRRANLTTSAQIAADNSSFEVQTSASRQNQLYTVDYNNIQKNTIIGNGSIIVQNFTETTIFGSPLSSGHFILSLDAVQVDYPNGSISLQLALNQTFYRITPNALTGLHEIEHAVVTTTSWFVIKEDGNVGSGNTSVTLNFLSPHRQYVRDVRAVDFQVTYDYESDSPVEFVQER
jgi:Peptide N-acetyl-beta-D-glucosaminyl asparaginase amidase A